MKCLCCGNEMESGEEVTLSSHNWTRPTCRAFHCAVCQKIVIDYAGENEK